MRFLVDNALSPALAAILRQHGHEASHVRGPRPAARRRWTIFDAAARQEAVVVSADTDFGTLRALRASTRPSVMLFRGTGSRRAEFLAATILANLPRLADLLAAGNTPRRIVVRTAGDAASVLPALERAVRAVHLDIAVRSGVTLDDALKRSFHAQPRFSLVRS